MGFRVETYSLDELNSVATPGTAPPALFWVLPVGQWDSLNIEEFWQHFTQRPGYCRDLGLLLVKDMSRDDGDTLGVSLSPVGAKLADLFPPGIERLIDPAAYSEGSPKLLLLSGGYPQPGWGVVVDFPSLDFRIFDVLIGRAIEEAVGDDLGESLNVFKRAAMAFHSWIGPEARKPLHGHAQVEKAISSARRVDVTLCQAQSCMAAGDYNQAGTLLQALRHEINEANWLNMHPNVVDHLIGRQRKLLKAGYILNAPSGLIEPIIEPNLQECLVDASKLQGVFRSLPNKDARRVFKACLELRSEHMVKQDQSLLEWAKAFSKLEPSDLSYELGKLRDEVTEKIARHEQLTVHFDDKGCVSSSEGHQSVIETHESSRAALGKAIRLQWELGPRFLVALEKSSQSEDLHVTSVPWDPARMVGWKISASGVSINSRDLRDYARELLPEGLATDDANRPLSSIADGSFFTDYVHHVAISRPGSSPRAVTRELIAKTLRLTEIRDLIRAYGGLANENARESELVEDLLLSLGWYESSDWRETPLASCIKEIGDGRFVVTDSLGANQLRIVVESFCKDIVDVLVAQLRLEQEDVWRIIAEKVPHYVPSSVRRNWADEVGRMTSGKAVLIVDALGSVLELNKEHETKRFVDSLRRLTNLLNEACHHSEGQAERYGVPDEGANLVNELLDGARLLLGELPWHMDASSVYGELPRVISGEAWSHESPTPRLMRVMVWPGENPGRRFVFWNRTMRNPVVVDPVFIKRPRRTN